MNCEKFQELVPEYLDESLGSGELAAARQHLQCCAQCQQALAREEALAKSLRVALDRETEGLFLSAETRSRILEAAETKAAVVHERQPVWAWLKSIRLRPALAGAALVGALVVILGTSLYRRSVRDSNPLPQNQGGEYAWVIDVPMRVQSYTFRQQNNATVDAIATTTFVGRAGFFETSKPLPKSSSKPL